MSYSKGFLWPTNMLLVMSSTERSSKRECGKCYQFVANKTINIFNFNLVYWFYTQLFSIHGAFLVGRHCVRAGAVRLNVLRSYECIFGQTLQQPKWNIARTSNTYLWKSEFVSCTLDCLLLIRHRQPIPTCKYHFFPALSFSFTLPKIKRSMLVADRNETKRKLTLPKSHFPFQVQKRGPKRCGTPIFPYINCPALPFPL